MQPIKKEENSIKASGGFRERERERERTREGADLAVLKHRK